MFRVSSPARLSAGLALCALALVGPAPAGADPLLEDAVAFNGQIFHLQSGAPGIVFGAIRGGESAVAGFGETRAGNGIVPDGDTVLRVGSITKVFTGEMLAHAVARGETAFTAPVAPLLPGRLADAAGRHAPIRLIDLATHAGGLPREVPHPEGTPADPFGPITLDAFADWLEESDLLFPPGRAMAYSNFGFDLLSTALSTAGGAPYPDLLRERIAGPRGMADTRFDLSDDMKARAMSGHGFDGEPLPDAPTGDVIVGSGGLRTTANDLLRWMAWHLADDTEDGEDAEVRFLGHGVYVQREGLNAVLNMDESGRMDAMGLGWVAMNATGERPFVLQKAGALQGQMSYLAFAPERGTAVFVSMNQYDFAAAGMMTEFANAFLASLSGD